MPNALISIFDMDHTLIDNDCDVSWKVFLVKKNLAPINALEMADKYFRQYVEGRLDMDAFLEFQLAEFKGRTPEDMAALAREHCESTVKPRIYRDAVAEIETAQSTGRILAICTSTNEVIARPVADLLGIPNLLATRLELRDGKYTGRIQGPYCGGEGKIPAAADFCREHGTNLNAVTYYGDSKADIPLLSEVGTPVVVNPAPALRETAEKRNWQIRRFA